MRLQILAVRSVDDAHRGHLAVDLRVEGVGVRFDGMDDLLPGQIPIGPAEVGDPFIGTRMRHFGNACHGAICHH